MCKECAEQMNILAGEVYASRIVSSVNGKVKATVRLYDAYRRLREARKAKAQAIAAKDVEIKALKERITFLEGQWWGDTIGAVCLDLETFQSTVARMLSFLHAARDKKTGTKNL
jgi:hypothetical protein